VIHGQLKSGDPLGQYRLIREVGLGSFGVVWEARDRLGRRIALKIPKGPCPASLEPLTEAWHQARLDHENIIRIYGVEEVQNLGLIAMEFADGGSLRQRLETTKIDWRDALRYGQSLCRALAAAHGQGIVHGDLKPENILFSTGGILKVTDFGLSALIGLRPGQSAGSIPYMASERFEGHLEPRADLWSLGVVLYEALTGQLPFVDRTPEAIIEKIRHKKVIPLRALEPDVPEEFAWVISRLLGQESHTTYGTASSLLEHLSRLEERTWQGAATSLASAATGTAATLPENAIKKILHKRSSWRRIKEHPAAIVAVLALVAGGITYSAWAPSRPDPENAAIYFESGLSHARSSRHGEAIKALGLPISVTAGPSLCYTNRRPSNQKPHENGEQSSTSIRRIVRRGICSSALLPRG
jgi:serine/threonine protein kinase